MSKYRPLTEHLKRDGHDRVPMTFTDIERVIEGHLPPSSRTHRAWWSNNPSNNVMTKAWLTAGYETEQVDIAGESLVFRRKKDRNEPGVGSARTPGAPESKRRFFGFMKGTLVLEDGFQPTQPTGETWDADRVGEKP